MRILSREIKNPIKLENTFTNIQTYINENSENKMVLYYISKIYSLNSEKFIEKNEWDNLYKVEI
jgi:hypothetical protein